VAGLLSVLRATDVAGFEVVGTGCQPIPGVASTGRASDLRLYAGYGLMCRCNPSIDRLSTARPSFAPQAMSVRIGQTRMSVHFRRSRNNAFAMTTSLRMTAVIESFYISLWQPARDILLSDLA